LRTRLKFAIGLAIAVLISLGVCILLSVTRTGDQECRGTFGSKCVIASRHATDEGKQGRIVAYNCCDTRTSTYRFSRVVLAGSRLMGYDKERGAWILLERSFTANTYDVARLTTDEKTTLLSLGYSEHTKDAVLLKDRVFVPVLTGGKLTLFIRSLNDKISQQVTLGVSNVALEDYPSLPIAVAPNGHIVAALKKRGHSDGSRIYLFKSNGRLIKCLGPGASPRYNSNGQVLAYRKLSSKGSNVFDTGRIVVHNLKMKTIKDVCIAKTGCSCNRNHASSDMREYQLSPDGQALICSYVQGWPVRTASQSIYLVDLSNDTPQWHKLPIQVLPGWVVLDRVPSSFVRDCDKN
jgi:hypothetical protein